MIYFITGNKSKFLEAKEILPEIKQMEIDLVEIQHLDPYEIVNYKIIEARNHTNQQIVVDDVSLYFGCFNNTMPGPLIKWFEKAIGNQGIWDMVNRYDDHSAFVKNITGYFDGSTTIYFEGIVKGKIVSPRGDNGFGWDRIFEVDGIGKTYAELSFDEKLAISHRKISLEKLKKYLNEQR